MAGGNENMTFTDIAHKAVVDSEAYERTAVVGEIDREMSQVFFADWPKVESILPSLSSTPSSSSVEEISWSTYHHRSSTKIHQSI